METEGEARLVEEGIIGCFAPKTKGHTVDGLSDDAADIYVVQERMQEEDMAQQYKVWTNGFAAKRSPSSAVGLIRESVMCTCKWRRDLNVIIGHQDLL